jgi:TonB-dependent receptor
MTTMLQRQIRSLSGFAMAAAFVVGLLAAPPASAQSTGTVMGRVADQTGAALPGAQASIRTLNLRAVTSAQGEFTIASVPEGTHELEIEYLGFYTVTQSVTVTGGQRFQITVTMVPTFVLEEAVTVEASPIREGQARALNQQRMADHLTSVVSADAIGRFPDPNVAEALQRTPGIAIERDQGEGRYINVRGAPAEFTQVAINGIMLPAPDPGTRAMDLDTIPSDIVSQIEVNKSLRPDLDADSIAGSVNIVTASPFDASQLRIRATGGGTYNDYGGSDTRGSFLLSNLFGSEKQFGALLSYSYSKTRRQVDNVESDWDALTRPEGGEVFGVVENLFKDYDTRRERIATTAAFEWRATPTDRFLANVSYARFEDDEYRNRLGILWDEGALLPGATDTSATWRNVRLSKQFRHRTQRNDVTSVSFSGRHAFARGLGDYTVSFGRADQTYPNRNELLYRTGANVTLSYDYSRDPSQPTISLFNTNEHLDLARFSFRENTFRSNVTREDEISAAANLEMLGAVGSTQALHKLGVKFRLRTKTADEERWRDRRTQAAPSDPIATLVGDVRSDNFAYLLGSKFDPARTKAYLAGARPASERRMPESVLADYEVGEDIYAAYGSTMLSLGRARLLLGARIEHTSQETFAPGFNPGTGAFTDRSANRSYTNVFPGATLRYAFTDRLIGRAAVTRAINRPNFREIVPRLVENDEVTRLRVTSGNPDLRPTLATNLDAALEYYMAPIGILSAGVFYKDLRDYRFDLTLGGTFGGRPALITRPENAPDGRVAGLEVAWQQQFDRLPGWWAGFGAFVNYTYTDAYMNLGREYEGRARFPLAGQSTHTSNAGLFYERRGFNARLAFTDRSDYLDEIFAEDDRFDLYWGGRGQLDVTSSYQVTSAWEVYAEAKNLTDTAGIRYFGDRRRIYEYEKFGYNLFLGLRFKY